MSGGTKNSESNSIAFLFLLIPTIMLIVGYVIFWPETEIYDLTKIPMFLGPILLGIGFVIKKQEIANIIKILGWMVFAFFWATQPAHLYYDIDGDIFNFLQYRRLF